MTQLFFLATLICAGGGPAALYGAWLRRRTAHAGWLVAGWGLVGAGTAFGAAAAGDGGVMIAWLVVTASALICLGVHLGRTVGTDRQPARSKRRRQTKGATARARGWAAGTRDLLIALPGGALASLTLALAATLLLQAAGAATSTALVAAAFVWPLAWTGLVTVVVMTRRVSRQLGWLAGCATPALAVLLTLG